MLAVAIALTSPAVSAQAVPDAVAARHAVALADRGWVWPSTALRLVRPFQAPAHAYGAGHRGIDLDAVHSLELRSPAAGSVAFVGPVAGRGILTIDHGDGLVTTLEPIDTDLRPGAMLRAGDAVGTVALGGHAAAGVVHFGVRLHGEYINPMLLLGGVPRAVLLPCC